jgi:AraC-like DNA-binding protein
VFDDAATWAPVAPTSFAIAQACQVAIGVVVSAQGFVDVSALVAPFQGIPSPRGFGDAREAARLLQEFTVRAGFELHRQHLARCDNCGFDQTAFKTVGTILNSPFPEWRPATIIKAWAQWLERELATRHLPDVVVRVTRAFNIPGHESLRVCELAGELGVSTRVLQRRFADATGTSIRRYRTELRVAKAFDRLRDSQWKIEAIAKSVGWNSKKDLYMAFSRYLGTTPGAIRRLGAPDAAATRKRLPDRYLCGKRGS